MADIKPVHTYPTNLVLRSEIIVCGKPCICTTWSKNAQATDSVSVCSPRGISLSILENLSTTRRTVDLPETVGNSVKKSIARSVLGTTGI